MLSGLGLDAVIVLNPMSSRARAAGGGPINKVAGAMRASAGRRLGNEVRKLREEGTEVLVLQPTADDLQVMGANLMARGRRAEVLEMARRSTALDLRSKRGRLPKLLGCGRKRTIARRGRTRPVISARAAPVAARRATVSGWRHPSIPSIPSSRTYGPPSRPTAS